MKMSMNIPDQEVTTIRNLSARFGNMTNTIRAAVRVLIIIDDAEKSGRDVLIRNPDTGETDRLVIL